MCKKILNDSTFISSIVDLDRKIAEQTRLSGCCFCKGPLDVAHYRRKPRGAPTDPKLLRKFQHRFSFCCRNCRKRHTPMSVRFLGRRVYLAVTIVLACAISQGLTDSRIKTLESFGINRQTLHLWLSWWRNQFVLTPTWREITSHFLGITQIPLDPLMMLQAEGLVEKLLLWLQMIKRLSVDPSVLLRVDLNPQNF